MKERLQSLRANGKSGIALVIVICLMAVFMMLSLAALLAASSLANDTERDLYREQARVAAVTLMSSTVRDITDATAETDIQRYLRTSMSVFEQGGAWIYYDENSGLDTTGYTRAFTVPVDGANDIEATLYIYWAAETAAMNDPEMDTEARCGTVKLMLNAVCIANGEEYDALQTLGVTQERDVDDNPIYRWYVMGEDE